MPGKKTYLVRRLADNTMRTVTANSARGAMAVHMVRYVGAEAGEEFLVKERLTSDWEAAFRVSRTGFRKISL